MGSIYGNGSGVAARKYRLRKTDWLGTRIFHANTQVLNIVGNTFQNFTTIEQHADQVRVIISNSSVDRWVIDRGNVTSTASFADRLTPAAISGWVGLTFTQARTATISFGGAGGPAGPINWTSLGGNPRRPAYGTATLVAGIITAITITDGGDGYETTDKVSLFFTDVFTAVPLISLNITSAASVTMPPRFSATEASYTLSDWVNLSTVARTDVTNGAPIVVIRLYCANAAAANMGLIPCNSVYDALDKRFFWWTYQAVDGVTTPASFTRNVNDLYAMASGVQYRARNKVMSVLAVGDSITYGTVLGAPFGFTAVYGTTGAGSAASVPQTDPVEFSNLGISGQTTAQYVLRVEQALKTFTPHVLIYAPYSPNDGVLVDGNAYAQRQRLALVVALCDKYNALLVIWTGNPNNGLSVTTDGYRLSFNTYLQTLNLAVADTAVTMQDGASPNKYIAAYSDDGVHPNAAGIPVMGVPMGTVLKTIATNNT